MHHVFSSLVCVTHTQSKKAAARQKKMTEKVLADHELLLQARGILQQHQHNRAVCTKKLLVPHYRVLLTDLGAGEKVRETVDGRTVMTKRPGLVQAYWALHVDVPVPEGTSSSLPPSPSPCRRPN